MTGELPTQRASNAENISIWWRHHARDQRVNVISPQVSEEAVQKRYKQGWLQEVTNDPDDLFRRIRRYRKEDRVTSIGFHGNVVDVW